MLLSEIPSVPNLGRTYYKEVQYDLQKTVDYERFNIGDCDFDSRIGR
jgi:hypothetical protein